MSLTIIDPYDTLYAFEASLGTPVKKRVFRKSDVTAVDRLLEEVGCRQAVSSESDWVALERVLEFYWKAWPGEAKQFHSTIPDIRHTRNSGGYSKSREIKYVGAVPVRLNKLIKVIFPSQQWDKRFVNAFVKRFKLFKVGGELN